MRIVNNIRDRKYRIVPVILGNRLTAWKLQHRVFFIWVDTVFENGKVICYEKQELLETVAHLKSKIEEF